MSLTNVRLTNQTKTNREMKTPIEIIKTMVENEVEITIDHVNELLTKEREHRDKQIKKAVDNYKNSIPEDTVIRDNAREMDEKEFSQWWWETMYKKRHKPKYEPNK